VGAPVRVVVVTTVVALLARAVANVRADPAQALVGRWEGEDQTRSAAHYRLRMLIISSLTQQDGMWVAAGPVLPERPSGRSRARWTSLRCALRYVSRRIRRDVGLNSGTRRRWLELSRGLGRVGTERGPQPGL
jgi:hypothetical protein